MKDAFWAESFKVAPVETAQAVERALVAVLSATDPARGSRGAQASRACRSDRGGISRICVRLAQALGGRLPPELAAIRELLAADASDALRALRVISVEGVPALSRWQRALIEKLNRDAGERTPDRGARRRPDDRCWRRTVRRARRAHSGVLQSRLYRADGGQGAARRRRCSGSGCGISCRKRKWRPGMVQRLLAEDAKLKPADIGLLLPDEFEYAVAVEDAFRLGGLALSGLPAERWRRDLGREAVFHFLYCRQKPAPAMALAVCLSSPLMPWSREQGAELAQTVMDGDYELEAAEGCECGGAGDARAAARGGQ